MKKLFTITGALAIAFVLVGFRTPVAAAATTLTSCRTITTSGDYVLGNDITSGGTCFSIRVPNVTFNGNGRTITVSSGDALEVAYYGSGQVASNVSISNFSSNSGVRTYGNTIHHVTFDHLTVDGVTVYGSDDVTITNNTLGAGGISVNNTDTSWPPYRPIITGNTITGPVGHTNKILLEIAGGANHPCPRIDAVVTNNTINNYRTDVPQEANASVRVRCATHTTFTDNVIRSTGTTIGLYMRDESDDGVYRNNSFHTNSHEAIRIASGNVDKTFPSRNIFERNTFVSDTGAATFIQGMGSNNQFVNNLFWSADSGLIDGADGNIYDHNTFYVSGAGQSIHTFNYDHGPTDVWTNNIFSYSGAATVYGFDGFTTDRYSAHHNLFQNRAGSVTFFNYGNLAAWKSGTGDDASSFEANPLFANAAGGDFSLQSSSPARGQASNGTNLGYDGTVVPQLTPNPGSTTNPGPTVSIVAPTGKTTLSGRYLVRLTASDADGIGRINFLVDGVKFGTDIRAPFRAYLDTRPLRYGRHTIRIVATDTKGNTSAVERLITVNNALAIRLLTPWTSLRVRGTVTLRPEYIYGGASIARVEYWVDRKLRATSRTSPYSVRWFTARLKNGLHRVTIRVVDSAGKKATHTVTIRVSN